MLCFCSTWSVCQSPLWTSTLSLMLDLYAGWSLWSNSSMAQWLVTHHNQWWVACSFHSHAAQLLCTRLVIIYKEVLLKELHELISNEHPSHSVTVTLSLALPSPVYIRNRKCMREGVDWTFLVWMNSLLKWKATVIDNLLRPENTFWIICFHFVKF